MFTKKTIRDIRIKDRCVLVRADYNVPISASGTISDDFRLKQSLPTINELLQQNARVVICSHLGRPDGKPNPQYSLEPVARRLSELLGRRVLFAPDCIGPEAEQMAKKLKPRQVLLLENVRFHPEEESNGDQFAQKLAKLGEVFVQDAFGVAHRAHASTDAITRYLPSVAGLLLEREVDTITNVMKHPERPLGAVVGGAKIADKIDVLTKLIDMADFVAIGGAMGNTFLAAKDIAIGKSTYDPNELELARSILAKAEKKSKQGRFVFFLPRDAVVATAADKNAKTRIVDWDTGIIGEIQNYPKAPVAASQKVAKDEMILDIGPFSAAFIAGGVQLARTVVWNGTLGVTEIAALHGPVGPFAHGTDLLIDALGGDFGAKPFTLVGGGDTVGYLEQRNITDVFDHVSTGGGASLELMAGRKLPAVEALKNR